MSSIFVVISYVSDEQQTFFDLIRAETAETASEIVADVRDYAEVVETMTLTEFKEVAKRMEDSVAVHPLKALELALLEFQRISYQKKADPEVLDCIEQAIKLAREGRDR